MQTRRNRVFTTKEAVASDVIWLSEITDAYDAGERQGFVVSRRSDRLHFYSRSNAEIVKVSRIVIRERRTFMKFGSRISKQQRQRTNSCPPSLLEAKASTQDNFILPCFISPCGIRAVLNLLYRGPPKVYYPLSLKSLSQIKAKELQSKALFHPFVNPVLTIKTAVLHQNPNTGIPAISEKLAATFPVYTVPLLKTFCDQFRQGSSKQKLDCLQVFGPWVKNLATFKDTHSELNDEEAKLREVILHLVDLDHREPEVCL